MLKHPTIKEEVEKESEKQKEAIEMRALETKRWADEASSAKIRCGIIANQRKEATKWNAE